MDKLQFVPMAFIHNLKYMGIGMIGIFLIIGIIMGEEEYVNKNGELRISLKAVKCCSGPKIRKGEFKVPELKKLPANTTAQKASQPAQQAAPQSFGTNVPFDDECPF